MKRKSNYPLLLSGQFFGALGDNALLAIILGQLTFLNQGGGMTDESVRFYNALFSGMLFVPYVVFAPWVGFLNDRFPKTYSMRVANCLKLLGTFICLGCLGHPTVLQGIGYFIVGTGACAYSPAKYGILPEIVPHEWLVKANGCLEMLTLVAILSGFIGGSWLIDQTAPSVGRLSVPACYWVLIGVYALSLLFACCMSRTPQTKELRCSDSFKAFFAHVALLLGQKRIFSILLGTTVFWFAGSVIKMNFQPWGLQVLGLHDNTQIAMLGLWLSIGLIIGNTISGFLYKTSDLRHVRYYGFGLTAVVFVLGFITSHAVVIGLLILTGAVGGLFLIPLNAAFQAETPAGKLGKTVAVQNFLENIAMCISSIFIALVTAINCPVRFVFVGLSFVLFFVILFLRTSRKN